MNKSKTTANPQPDPSCLIHKFFHCPLDKYSGHVAGYPEPGWYYVEMYHDCFEGTAGHLVPFSRMNGWLFFDAIEELQRFLRHQNQEHGGKSGQVANIPQKGDRTPTDRK